MLSELYLQGHYTKHPTTKIQKIPCVKKITQKMMQTHSNEINGQKKLEKKFTLLYTCLTEQI